MSRNYREPAKTIRKGDVIKASNLNKLVTTQAFNQYSPQKEQYQGQVERKPFDCISCVLSGDRWKFKLKTSYTQINSFPVEILGRVGTAARPLSESVFDVPFNDGEEPEIERFYYDRDENQLKDQRFVTGGLETDPAKMSLNQRYQYILEVETANSGITFKNYHPYSIEKLYTFPFEVIAVPVDDANVYVTVSPGYVCNVNNKDSSDETVKYHMPEIDVDGDKVPLDEWIDDEYNSSTRPFIPVTASSDFKYIYLKISTDPRDIITDPPEVILSDESDLDFTSTHAHPNPIAQDGEYYLKLARIKVTAATLSGDYLTGPYANTWLQQIHYGSPIIWRQVDPEFENLGGKIEVWKEFDPEEAIYKFRTIEQLEGRGETIIKALTSSDAETIPFKRIAERVTQPQVRVTTEGDDDEIVEIKGNGYDESLSDVSNFSISVVDGLVTSILPTTPSLSGWWGTIVFQHQPNIGSSIYLSMQFANGILTQVTDESGVVSGTEDTPGFTDFITQDDT
jgi:hypothetical protein